ncbi:hypothetical protein LOAG_05599 [Loa loa]|uniref:Uncharacterized protein n=1 Tax=Loa loa TaxID=7209 RepID=A0A1S0TZZ2_LOALO|nr:hypothetical protein LOAG_05599 [Loa loa]EFO22887.1 hypothetical protein LOAG_05599 [Loa loa]
MQLPLGKEGKINSVCNHEPNLLMSNIKTPRTNSQHSSIKFLDYSCIFIHYYAILHEIREKTPSSRGRWLTKCTAYHEIKISEENQVISPANLLTDSLIAIAITSLLEQFSKNLEGFVLYGRFKCFHSDLNDFMLDLNDLDVSLTCERKLNFVTTQDIRSNRCAKQTQRLLRFSVHSQNDESRKTLRE